MPVKPSSLGSTLMLLPRRGDALVRPPPCVQSALPMNNVAGVEFEQLGASSSNGLVLTHVVATRRPEGSTHVGLRHTVKADFCLGVCSRISAHGTLVPASASRWRQSSSVWAHLPDLHYVLLATLAGVAYGCRG